LQVWTPLPQSSRVPAQLSTHVSAPAQRTTAAEPAVQLATQALCLPQVTAQVEPSAQLRVTGPLDRASAVQRLAPRQMK
jgi:hypothetical protein